MVCNRVIKGQYQIYHIIPYIKGAILDLLWYDTAKSDRTTKTRNFDHARAPGATTSFMCKNARKRLIKSGLLLLLHLIDGSQREIILRNLIWAVVQTGIVGQCSVLEKSILAENFGDTLPG